jgi:hypothetical protein
MFSFSSLARTALKHFSRDPDPIFPEMKGTAPPPPCRTVWGLDLGQAQDYSALAVNSMTRTPGESGRQAWSHGFRVLHRWPLRTSYTSIIDDLGKLAEELPGSWLVVDATGVGKAITEMVFEAHLPVAKVVPVVIHGGHRSTLEGGCWHAAKADLVGSVNAAMQRKALAFAPGLREAPQLQRELRAFRSKVNMVTRHESYEHWRERDKDDLVFAVGLAVWYGTKAREFNVNSFAV